MYEMFLEKTRAYCVLVHLQEELEVLQSIYEGDDAFKQISETVFQYKARKNSIKNTLWIWNFY